MTTQVPSRQEVLEYAQRLIAAAADASVAGRMALSMAQDLVCLNTVYLATRQIVVRMENCGRRSPHCCVGHALKTLYRIGPEE